MAENGSIKKERLSTKVRKKLFLEALEKSMGVQTPARKAAGIESPETIRNWRSKDEAFARAMDECKAICGDFVESKLLQKIKDGDTTAIIFYCKTQLKERGYTERKEITGAEGKDIFAQMSDEELNNEIAELKRKLDM